MVLCMAFLVPVQPYFGLPNRGQDASATSTPFADDDTVAEMVQTGSHGTKQSV
jgi:hypothetical protein